MSIRPEHSTVSDGAGKGQYHRRRFIKSAGATLLGALSAGFFLRPREAFASDAIASARISSSSRKVVETLAETIVPSEGPDRPGALDGDAVDRLLDWLGGIPGARDVFLDFCWFWEFSPVWSGRWARFSRLGLPERTKLLEQWQSSRMPLKRGALLLLKAVFLAAFYNDPKVWPHIGYQPGCLSPKPAMPVK